MNDFVAIDFETAKKSQESACSVGLVKFQNGKVTDSHFNIVYQAHNALGDAMTCGKLVQMAWEKLGKRKSVKGLLKAAGIRMKLL